MFVGFDTIYDGKDAVREGKVTATIIQNLKI